MVKTLYEAQNLQPLYKIGDLVQCKCGPYYKIESKKFIALITELIGINFDLPIKLNGQIDPYYTDGRVAWGGTNHYDVFYNVWNAEDGLYYQIGQTTIQELLATS